MTHRIPRRSVLKSMGALAATAAVSQYFPTVLASTNPGRKLNVAAIGCGMRGLYLEALHPDLNYVALVDPDQVNMEKALKNLSTKAAKSGPKDFDASKLKTFSDYRTLFDKMHKDIDLVLIATPDHQHAFPAMQAIKLGKHVYCEKPLVHHISEARALGDAARNSPVVTQMGNQGSGKGGHRTLAEWLAAGAIGKLKEVHAWHNFIDRFGGSAPKPETQSAPSTLDWDAWLGPALDRPYSSAYVHEPTRWHGWHDFGTGSLGGWGPHMMDAIYFALKLGYPQRVELLDVGDVSEDRFPRWSTVRYDFPQRGDMAPISVFWHEGAKPVVPGVYTTPQGKPAKSIRNHPEAFAQLEQYSSSLAIKVAMAGNMFIGDKGMIVCPSHGSEPILLPESRRAEFTLPPKTLPRAVGGIMGDFISACKAGGGPTFSGLGTFAGPFIESLLTGHLAMRAGLNNPVEWDGAAMKSTNRPELNQYVTRDYRKGWVL